MTRSNRELIQVPLVPAGTARFQPTGFPDIGPGRFSRPDGKGGWEDALLVESAQSMANRLEAQGWDEGANEPHPVLAGLPYVRVVAPDGAYLTSSRTEAHRLASSYVKGSTLDGQDMKVVIRDRLGLTPDKPLDHRAIAVAVMALDPLCLVHGVFFAEDSKIWPGQPKIARALTGFVEAVDVREAHSGGVKRDDVGHQNQEGRGSKEGFGSIPFHRVEFTAQRITATFSIDLAQLRSYGLGDDATALLLALARWEIRSLVDGGLRFRTACDFDTEGVVDLPSSEELGAEVARLVSACGEQLGSGGALTVTFSPPKATSGRGKKQGTEAGAPDDVDVDDDDPEE
jgi:CRISPR-associated protein Csb1